MTDSRPDADSTPSKPRGLWSLMGTPADPPVSSTQEDAAVDHITARDEPDVQPAETAPEPPAPRKRGLWGMMHRVPGDDSAAVEAEHPSADPHEAEHEQDDSADQAVPPPEAIKPAHQPKGPRGLFALMNQSEEDQVADPETESVDAESVEPGRHDDALSDNRRDASPQTYQGRVDDDEDLLADEEHSVRSGSAASPRATETIDPDDLEPPRYRQIANHAHRQAWIGLGCGITAVLASALSLLPNFLASLPSTAIGFVAIILGYLALTGAGRRDMTSSMRVVCLAGMLLGTAGIFLGPLLIADLGRDLRDAGGQQSTRLHLEAIATGLDQHYVQHDGYPVGGTFARNEAGMIVGQHGWMTFLLPFVGESELYQQIDLSLPYDEPANRNPMGRNVTIYFAAGGDRSRIGEGFAVSHYAGVGGEIDDASGLSHLGIFERDASVKRDEVIDGLSNTLIVGELAGTYPPWGDPENWRKIGRGLNKDVNGFGSYGGNGASFLLGDGSVRFFNNKTDPKLLERMSTRDGSEDVQ